MSASLPLTGRREMEDAAIVRQQVEIIMQVKQLGVQGVMILKGWCTVLCQPNFIYQLTDGDFSDTFVLFNPKRPIQNCHSC
jgi:hypothetical protein